MRAPKTKPACQTTVEPQAGRDADHAVTALYRTHYQPLVRMAALLVEDLTTAEEIVQDSFVAVHAAWRRRPDADQALSYLHRSVVNRSRSRFRPPGARVAYEGERSAFISALWTLPARQREVMVLRYFADLPATQIAWATGISEGAVRAHTARAMSSMRAELRKAR
jgi:DNA-directed RNA polymerase specialized sigma24 family protein